MKEKQTDLVRVTVRVTRKQKEQLERRAEKSGVSMAEYMRSLLTKKALAVEPPEELWEVMEELYSLHRMLLRIKKPEFTEAAHRLERSVVNLQAVFTKPRKAAS